MIDSQHKKSLDKWIKLIKQEMLNPLTVAVELTRNMEYDKSFPEPLTMLTVKIKQIPYKEESK